MKALLEATQSSLKQVQLIIAVIDEIQAERSEEIFAHSGIGRHIRHITDHFLALEKGLSRKEVDYNQRNRHALIETDINVAKATLNHLQNWLQKLAHENKRFMIVSEISCEKEASIKIASDLQRELLYLINHTIHHAAYIKLMVEKYNILLPDEIGIAPGTATYYRQEAQHKISNTLGVV